MTRRSTRSSKRSASPSLQDAPKKRARTKRSPEQSTSQEGNEPRTRRRIAGKLASIMTIPVDVFCEIAFCLSPEDLLSIARASRTLRNLLMSKSSRLIWAAAEQSVGMPPCPPDLSYPQYASLLFDKFCMNCLAHRARRVNIETRARLCKKCEVTKLVSGSGLIPEDMDIMDLAALIPGDKLSCIISEYWFGTYLLLRCQGQRYYEALIISACREYEASGKDRTWLFERSKRLYKLSTHACKVNNWLSGRKRDRQSDIKSLKQNRRESIYRRLEDLGYSVEDHSTLCDIEYRKWNVLIDQPRELTEKAWAILQPQLEEIIRLRREKKFRIARQDCVTSREWEIQGFTLSVLKSNEAKLLLSFEELIQLPDVSKIINADGFDKTISEGDFQVVKTSAIELGTKRKQEAVEMCGSAMAAAFVDCGLLPANVMTGDCGEDESKNHPFISTSSVLEHSCALFAFKDGKFDPSRASFNDLVSLYHSTTMRNMVFELYAPSSQAILIAKRLAEDLDVVNSTLSELDLLGEIFICARCDPIFRKKLNWQHLVQHFLEDKKDFERVKARYRGKLTLETIFANDHCLDDVSTGESAINISSIDNALDLEIFIKECKCESGDSCWIDEHCKICTKIGAVTTRFCEKGMRVHMQKKHGPLSKEEIMKELIGSSS